MMLFHIPTVVAAFALGATGCSRAAEPSPPTGPTTAAAPSKRAHHALVYDEQAGRIVLIGGSTSLGQSFNFFDDLWSFTGGRWTLLGTTGFTRSGQAVAYDSKRNRILAFGGYCTCKSSENGRYNDLLELQSNRWVGLGAIQERPSTDAGMVFDTKRDRAVLFGGSGGNQQALADTWEFDGTSWARKDVSGPGALIGFSMVYDDKAGRTLVYGGFLNNPNAPSSAVWSYDGVSWRQVSSNGPALHTASATYDTQRGLLIVFGGLDASGFKADTWSWDGAAWRKLADSGPSGRVMGAMAYDKKRDRVVLHGGRDAANDLNDTWEWDGTRWRLIAPD